jgi:hypothetical protein
VSWVCGPEPALVAEVVGAYKAGLPAAPVSLWFAGPGGERLIWDELLTPPAWGGRLSVIYNAQLLDAEGTMAVLLAEGAETAFTVFVSSEKDFARVTQDGKEVLAPHLSAIQASKNGQLVRCCKPAKEEDTVRLVAGWWPGAGANLAAELISRNGGNLSAVRDACSKAVRAALEPVSASVALLCRPALASSFADTLLVGDRKGAVMQAGMLRHGEVGQALGLLAHRLTVVGALALAKQRDWGPDEVARKLKIDRIQQHLLGTHAGFYTPERIARCRELLAMAETVWRDGATDGVAEAVACLW